jgi:L-alanine-DL-glutamate epimerase-like enolase superfamily enzyme
MSIKLGSEAPIEKLDILVYTIPTDLPESDGTVKWDHTTIVIVQPEAGGVRGIGYSYADAATARLIHELLADVVTGCDALAVPETWAAMVAAVRNLGRPGVAAMAISAVDNALWDLKARLLGISLLDLLGAARDRIPVYGSGGFTSYTNEQLQAQLGGWAAHGFTMVKMKIGRRSEDDLRRVRLARQAIGPQVQLFVDANGAYSRKQALAFADAFQAQDVTWFEEPVPADDLEGLRLMRDRAPAEMDIAAGEYGYQSVYFRRMLDAGAVDVLQADATRCCGITGFLQAAALCQAHLLPLSAHCAPNLHAHPCCAIGPARHLEYFHDHARIEGMLFDGALKPIHGALQPDRARPGCGLELKQHDAETWRVAF